MILLPLNLKEEKNDACIGRTFVRCQSKTRHVLVMVSLEVLHFVV